MLTSHKKELIWSLGVFTLMFFSINTIFSFADNLLSKRQASNTASVSALVVTEEKKTNIRMAFAGDMMLDRGVRSSVYKNFEGDYSKLFINVRDQLRGYDILSANLEGPVSDKGTDIGGIYSFRMEPKVAPILKEAGFDILSVANNHTYNWGLEAFTDTLQLLSDNGIIYAGGGFVGARAYKEKVINVEGVKIAFLSFSEFTAGGVMSSSTEPGMATISEENVLKSVSQARMKSDIVIVSFHFGEEYSNTSNTYQEKYAELSIDSGADLVIGHHTHVVQTLAQYKNTYIMYSLGNFIFDQYFSEETMQGGLLEVEINPESKRIETAVLKKVLLNKKFQIESIED